MATPITPLRSSVGEPSHTPVRASCSRPRSPKRARATPTLDDLSHTASSSSEFFSSSTTSRRRGIQRPNMKRQGTLYDTYIGTNAARPMAEDMGLAAYSRREMSVPMLSHTLSTFSLSQTPPGQRNCSPHDTFQAPTADFTFTPRRHPSCHTVLCDLPRVPFTAPIPQTASSLRSPFSTKSRGGYEYDGLPSARGAMSDVISTRQRFDDQRFGWDAGRDWNASEVQGDASPEHSRTCYPSLGSPSGRGLYPWTSSMDELSESGSSSMSLVSLARSSSEQSQRPWSFDGCEDNHDEHAMDQDTPSRQVCAWRGLQAGIPSRDMRETGLEISPRPATKTEVSPLHPFSSADASSSRSLKADIPSRSLGKLRSPLTSFLPRLLSSKKSGRSCAMNLDRSREESASTGGITDIQKHPDGSSVPVGLGIRIRESKSKNKPGELERTLSSSSNEAGPSPSKALTETSSATSDMPSSPLHPPDRPSLHRRKTFATPYIRLATARPQACPLRPILRRGITEPLILDKGSFLSPATAVATPVAALFGDIRPSPAAFASTGLVKKKSMTPGMEIPLFSESEPRIGKVVFSRLGISTLAHDDNSATNRTASTSDASVSVYVRAAQKTRGLRRKTSSMFTSSGSIGSVKELCQSVTSPLTPTKAVRRLDMTMMTLGSATSSPKTPSYTAYPFAPSTSCPMVFSPPVESHVGSDAIEVSSMEGRKSVFHALQRGPIARSSNPMLAATFDDHAGNNVRKASKNGRLERDFVILQALGRGEFSQVWKVKDRSSGALFAVKAGKTFTGHKNRLRQLEEVAVLHQLASSPHPRIIDFVDSWEHGSRLYIRTELASCGDLATFLLVAADTGGIGERRSWKVLHELSDGLAFIHRKRFLHLDLKPSNILITTVGSLKIADFGMSTVIPEEGAIGDVSPALPQTMADGAFVWDSPLEQRGRVVPSPIVDREFEGDREYLCPEALGGSTIGTEADVFSLGILILESALNVVLPPNGDGWVKLRNDDFSDCDEHYVSKDCSSAEHCVSALPVLSPEIFGTIKALMRADPTSRMTLEEVDSVNMLYGARTRDPSPALVDEK